MSSWHCNARKFNARTNDFARKLGFVDGGGHMMCVSVCEQPVSPGPVPIRREGAQVYTIGGIAFGASDSVSEVRADDEPVC